MPSVSHLMTRFSEGFPWTRTRRSGRRPRRRACEEYGPLEEGARPLSRHLVDAALAFRANGCDDTEDEFCGVPFLAHECPPCRSVRGWMGGPSYSESLKSASVRRAPILLTSFKTA